MARKVYIGRLLTAHIYRKAKPMAMEEDLKDAYKDFHDRELEALKEAFPGQGFSIVHAENDLRNHSILADTLEGEMVFLNVMGYSANAIDCLQIVIDEAREREAGSKA